jgi:hypothetical protein
MGRRFILHIYISETLFLWLILYRQIFLAWRPSSSVPYSHSKHQSKSLILAGTLLACPNASYYCRIVEELEPNLPARFVLFANWSH